VAQEIDMTNRFARTQIPVIAVLTSIFAVSALAQNANSAASGSQAQPSPPTTLAAVVDHDISGIEKMVVEVAEAMPEGKFNFSPESLNIPRSSFKGVRTFALQVRHVAASNYAIWAPLTGDTFPKDYMGGNGPENLQTKADIIKFLKDSFALGHKAAATVTPENMLETVGRGKSTRIRLANFGVAHACNHYGQMVEYLRMNGIVPPASRGKSE
jgi:DinB superfamily